MNDIKYDSKLSRKKPSKRYKKLLEEYIKMHSSAKGMFNGKSLTKFIYIIDNFLQSNNCKTLLDYGAGKGTLYTEEYAELLPELGKPLKEYWNLEIADRYEPAIPEFPSHDHSLRYMFKDISTNDSIIRSIRQLIKLRYRRFIPIVTGKRTN